MSVPAPPFRLENHCSVIHNDTLYAVSGNDFYSLPLKAKGKWTKLPGPIVSTEGQVCVQAHKDLPGEELYLVGGNVKMPEGSIPDDYSGLQRWSFTARQWEILPLKNQLVYNVTGHGSTYVEESNRLLVYGGSKWPQAAAASQQTYLINTLEPFATTAVPAGLCPPLSNPMMFPWDNGGMICGGGATNNHLFTYSAQNGWKQLSATLDHGLSKEQMGAALVDSDGGRTLLSFDFTKTPVEVQYKQLDSGKVRRQATGGKVSSVPKFAPGALSGFSMAYNDKYVTFLGGRNSKDAINIFDYTKNAWVDPANVFNIQKPLTNGNSLSISPQEVPESTSLPSSAPSSSLTSSSSTTTATTPSLSSTPTAAASTSSQNNTTTMKLLFIILGVVILVALILGIAYVILRCRRKRQATEKGSPGGSRKMRHSSTQSVLSIADRGVSFMKEAGGQPRAGVDYPDFANLPRGSTVGLAAGTSVEMQSRNQRGSGWSKYFSGNSQTNLVDPNRSRVSDSRSSYSLSSVHDDFEVRSISAPSLGHVRSSNATSSAVFSQILPTPIIANVMSTEAPKNGAGLVGVGDKRSTTLTMSSNFDTKSFASSFDGHPFWNQDAEAAGSSEQTWNPPRIGDEDSRVPSSIFAAYMDDGERNSSVTVFPGPFGFNNTPRHSVVVDDDDKGKAPQDQGLSWFKRT